MDKSGVGLFDFEHMNMMVKLGDVRALMDFNGWLLCAHQHVYLVDVLNALQMILNLKTFPFAHGR